MEHQKKTYTEAFELFKRSFNPPFGFAGMDSGGGCPKCRGYTSWGFCLDTKCENSPEYCFENQKEETKQDSLNLCDLYWPRLQDKLDELFPKGECKERGAALVLFAEFQMVLKELEDQRKKDREELILKLKESYYRAIKNDTVWEFVDVLDVIEKWL